MKKLLLILALSFLCPVFAGAVNADLSTKTWQDVQLKESTVPSKPIRTRAALPFVSAWIGYASDMIE